VSGTVLVVVDILIVRLNLMDMLDEANQPAAARAILAPTIPVLALSCTKS
jgi:hypothetical protein